MYLLTLHVLIKMKMLKNNNKQVAQVFLSLHFYFSRVQSQIRKLISLFLASRTLCHVVINGYINLYIYYEFIKLTHPTNKKNSQFVVKI